VRPGPTAQRGDVTILLKHLPVQHEQARVSLLDLRQVLLGQHVAVVEDGVDHLVQIGTVLLTYQEDVPPCRTAQRFYHYGPADIPRKGQDIAAGT
jgi:hypothetical protein